MKLQEFIGKTFNKVHITPDKKEMIFESTNVSFTFYHDQDCCEDVYIEDFEGELKHLENTPILDATLEQGGYEKDRDGLAQWSFYKFRTIKGNVDVRWYGESNGYYAIAVWYQKVEGEHTSTYDDNGTLISEEFRLNKELHSVEGPARIVYFKNESPLEYYYIEGEEIGKEDFEDHPLRQKYLFRNEGHLLN